MNDKEQLPEHEIEVTETVRKLSDELCEFLMNKKCRFWEADAALSITWIEACINSGMPKETFKKRLDAFMEVYLDALRE